MYNTKTVLIELLVQEWHNILGLYSLIFIILIEMLLLLLELKYLFHIKWKTMICFGLVLITTPGDAQYIPATIDSDSDSDHQFV